MNILKLGAAALALMALPVAAEAASGVSTANVNMRSGPSTRYPAVVVIPLGMRVEIYGCMQSANWCDVGFARYRGWVSGTYLQATYSQRRVYVDPRYYGNLGIPSVGFDVDDYWGDHYRSRDFYRDRDRWRGEGRPPRRDEYRRPRFDDRDDNAGRPRRDYDDRRPRFDDRDNDNNRPPRRDNDNAGNRPPREDNAGQAPRRDDRRTKQDILNDSSPQRDQNRQEFICALGSPGCNQGN